MDESIDNRPKALQGFKPATREEVDSKIEGLISGLDARTVKSVRSVPRKYRLMFARSLTSGGSPSLAIKMKCMDCVNFEEMPTMIGKCTVRSCPLWLVRPFQERAETSENEVLSED